MTKTLNVRIPMVPTVVRVEQGSQEMELHVKVVTDVHILSSSINTTKIPVDLRFFQIWLKLFWP